jgi:hypothetical protein
MVSVDDETSSSRSRRRDDDDDDRKSKPVWMEKYGPPTRTDFRLIIENLSSRVSWQVYNLSDLPFYLNRSFRGPSALVCERNVLRSPCTS